MGRLRRSTQATPNKHRNIITARGGPSINTPLSASECQPLLIKWAGGTPPYDVTVQTVQTNPAGTTPVADFPAQGGTSVTWVVNATVGTSLMLGIRGSGGLVAMSDIFTVTAGSGDSCIGVGDTSISFTTSTRSTSSAPSATAPSQSKNSVVTVSDPLPTAPRSSPTSSTSSTVTPHISTPVQNSDRNKLPAGAIIGIALGISSLILVAVFLIWLRKRHRQRHSGHTHPNSAFSPPTPEILVPMMQESNVAHNGHRHSVVSASATRRQYLANELRATHDKMVDLEDLERHTASKTATRSSAPSRILRLVSMRSASTTDTGGDGSQDLASQLKMAKQRNKLLAGRIRELEDQMHSPWALGLSDEPPPGYTLDDAQVV
ncbi:hypothetical protein C8R44DRAFT_990942 [Mycena epipterygia]|nr:hypothetical protein C8R44DRAFT_990942 [Mycena epipterygia]